MYIWQIVYFQVQNHKLGIIAVDGASVKSVIVDCIIGGSGERFDFILNTTTNPLVSEVFIRARALGNCLGSQVQEIARLFIVNDMSKVQKSNADHLPVANYPLFDVPYQNNIVRMRRLYSAFYIVPHSTAWIRSYI